MARGRAILVARSQYGVRKQGVSQWVDIVAAPTWHHSKRKWSLPFCSWCPLRSLSWCSGCSTCLATREDMSMFLFTVWLLVVGLVVGLNLALPENDQPNHRFWR